MIFIRFWAFTLGLLLIALFIGCASLTMSQTLIERPIECMEWGAAETVLLAIAGLFYRRRKK